jgi:hypothetical protein
MITTNENKENAIRKVHYVGSSVVLTIDRSHVKQLRIDDMTFFIQKPIENGIILELRKFESSWEVERRIMKVERNYNRTLSKGSLPETEYSDPQPGSNPNVNIIDSNSTNLRNSVEAGTSDIAYTRSEPYSYCDVCAWNGYLCEKVVLENFRIRPEDEDGFIYEFDTFDYDPEGKKRIPHKHKFNEELIDLQVNAILSQQESMQQEQRN